MSQNNDLSKLSSDVFVLIRNGIYSIYEIDGGTTEKYLLITNERKMFLLSPSGEITKEIQSTTGYKLKKTTLSGTSKTQDSVKLNYA